MATLLLIGGFFTVFFVVFPIVWAQLASLFGELPRMLKEGQALLATLPEQYPAVISIEQIDSWIAIASKELGQLGQIVVSFSLSTLPGLVALMLYAVLIPILVFFFLKDRELIFQWLTGFLPANRPVMTSVWHEMNDQIANYIRGKVIEILIVGVVSYITFAFMGLRYSALLGLLVGLSVLIPYIGATVVTIPVMLIAFFQWGWTNEFLYLFIAYSIIQGLDGNVLVPLLFSEAVNLHPVAIILSVLVFGGVWGFWGVFFAIPLATLVKALMSAWPHVTEPEGSSTA
jgi:putative permease